MRWPSVTANTLLLAPLLASPLPPPTHPRRSATTSCLVCGSISGMPTASSSCAYCWWGWGGVGAVRGQVKVTQRVRVRVRVVVVVVAGSQYCHH